MKRIIKLTESDLTRIVRRVIREQNNHNPGVTSIQCINGTEEKIVENNYNGLIKKGFECVGRKYKPASSGEGWSSPEEDDIYVKKYIQCGNTVKTLFIYIATKPFSKLIKVGDLKYYVPSELEGSTTLEGVDSLITKIQNNCK